MAGLVVAMVGFAGHVFHGVLEILNFQAMAFDASVAFLVAVVDGYEWLMVCIGVKWNA